MEEYIQFMEQMEDKVILRRQCSKLKSLVLPLEQTDSYSLYIAISSDTLLIIDKQLNLVESIIHGDDVDGVYVSCDNQNDFLDAIILLKKIILSGNNPLDYI